MSTITLFNNQEGTFGDHRNHTNAVAIIRCDDCFDSCFLACIGVSDMYDIINNLEIENTEYFFEYELV